MRKSLHIKGASADGRRREYITALLLAHYPGREARPFERALCLSLLRPNRQRNRDGSPIGSLPSRRERIRRRNELADARLPPLGESPSKPRGATAATASLRAVKKPAASSAERSSSVAAELTGVRCSARGTELSKSDAVPARLAHRPK